MQGYNWSSLWPVKELKLNWVEWNVVRNHTHNLKSQVWFRTKMHSTQFSYHFITSNLRLNSATDTQNFIVGTRDLNW